MTPTDDSSRLKASPLTPFGKSTISPAMTPDEAVDARDAVADFEDLADLARLDLAVEVGDLPGKDADDFARIEFIGSHDCGWLIVDR